jgi:hypothetical protein
VFPEELKVLEQFTHSQAATQVDPQRPPSRDTMVTWHDKVGGERDNAGRRLFTPTTVQKSAKLGH